MRKIDLPLNQFNPSNMEHISILDELPLWSAPFGIMLLNNITLKKEMKVLDLGCGTGFPLLELSQRLGDRAHLTGIDIWKEAIERCKTKISIMGIKNITLINKSFQQDIFGNNAFDLIVSNNGINNMKNQPFIYKECFRILKKGGELAFTFNLPDTMKEFYKHFKDICHKLCNTTIIEKIDEHIWIKRKSIKETENILSSCGFIIKDIKESVFYMRFIDGTAMLNSFFIKLAFMEAWKGLIEQSLADEIFTQLEEKLNHIAQGSSELRFSIPYAFFRCQKL